MRALVLDRTHNVLANLPDVPLTGARPLQALEAAMPLALPAPAGSRPNPRGGRDFAFVIDHAAAPADSRWLTLPEADGELWELYVALMLGGWRPPHRKVDVWSFGHGPEMAAQLAHLVACGEKRVTMGWIAGSQAAGIPLPYEDGYSIVTDGFGYPKLALRTVEVRETRFCDIEAATAAAEGEGDLTRADWHEGHVAYFTRQAARHDLAFDENALLAVERFEVLHVIGAAVSAPSSTPPRA
jgi:uncharacterized protein YhfF